MSGWTLAVVAVIVGVYAVFSGVLARHWISAALFFVAAGLIAGDELFGVLEPAKAQELLLIAAEATLALVLFTDASRLDVGRLRREFALPGRLLGIGLPLTILAGTALAAGVLGELSLVEALVLAIALAPTDAALGQAVVTDERVPGRVRQGLNVESGLNDGICVPLLLIALAVAEAHGGAIGEGEAVRLVVEEIGWGLVAGVVAGGLAAIAVRHAGRLAEPTWQQLIPLAAAALAYGSAVGLGGSGFIGAFVGGLVFAAMRPDQENESTLFTEEAGGVLDAITFVLFGALVLGAALTRADAELYLYAVLSLTIIRMLPVAVAMIGSHARRPTVAYVGWFGPRGLASIVFAVIILDEADLAGSQTIIDTISVTVALSVLLHGISAVPLTNRYVRWYGAHPRPPAMEGGSVQPVRWRRAPFHRRTRLEQAPASPTAEPDTS